MIESAKTLLFLACAVAVGALAWVARPADPGRGVVDDAGGRSASTLENLNPTASGWPGRADER